MNMGNKQSSKTGRVIVRQFFMAVKWCCGGLMQHICKDQSTSPDIPFYDTRLHSIHLIIDQPFH